MDNFPAVYDTFYNYKDSKPPKKPIWGRRHRPRANFKGTGLVPTEHGLTLSNEDSGLRPVPAGTIEVVGVFDTVA